MADTEAAGVKVTCENGHYVATYTGLLGTGEVICAERFTELAPGVGPFVAGEIIRERCCPRCDAMVFRLRGLGWVDVHTDDGWRP